MTDLELFLRYPQLRDLPHISLASLPTPVERLEKLGAAFEIPSLWVKRDDQSGQIYGGNKVRKLEFILGKALAEDYDQVWTVGAIGSHHVLATSLYARQLGLEPKALHFPQPVTAHVQQVLKALSTTRPELELIDSKNAIPGAMIKARLHEWLSQAEDPFYIPGGGSSPEGVLGYINAAFELARQVDEGLLPCPDAIYVAAGTCGTLAGLILGAKMAELPTEIIGVRVVDKVIANPLLTANLANRTAKILKHYGVNAPTIQPTQVVILDDFIASGYGEPAPLGASMIEKAQTLAQLSLDPTYTAKAFAGLTEHLRQSLRPPQNILYWHTLNSADLSPLYTQASIEKDLPPAYRKFFQPSF